MADSETNQRSNTPRWRRSLCTAVIFLILGAIVNVAVAWGCVLWSSPRDMIRGPWPTPLPEGWTEPDSDSIGQQGFGIQCMWGVVAVPVDRDTHGSTGTSLCAWLAGWPCHSLFMDRHFPMFAGDLYDLGNFSAPTQFQDGITIPGWFQSRSSAVCLPTRPLWSGFAADTLLYAVVLWLLIARPFHLRRWRRIRRGLCENCGYPIGTSPVCTECGEKVEPKEVMTDR
ncbi:MAG: hypothetical protein D8M59_08675 [Planctomycetes bacterium]|nr:hypothetical protein [Planctomycetota bacterium]NOG53927.1 hypothetical protein [Planctomycetota bacterium]